MSAYVKHSHCSWCGTAFPPQDPWPRTCAHCGNMSFLNPLPVAVMLVPANGGIVLIRRGIEPGRGKWALPGGFVELDETWQQAGAREVWEEAGIKVDPASTREHQVRSAPDGVILLFGVTEPVADLPEFIPNDEATERIIATAPPPDMAFVLHREALEAYLRERGK